MHVTVINHTNLDHSHFGCIKVEQNLFKILNGRAKQLSVVPTGTSSSNQHYLKILAETDLVIVNGEGTLHDGRKKAEDCLRLAAYAKEHGAQTWLINTVYQNNPPSWQKYLKKFDFIFARDSASAASISDLLGFTVPYLADISLIYEFENNIPKIPGKILISDSVSKRKSSQLLQFASQLRNDYHVDYMPLTSSSTWKTKQNLLERLKSAVKIGYYTTKETTQFPSLTRPNINYFMRSCADSDLHITGRFHAICFSLLTKTPFLALTSNTWKIENLVNDIGLKSDRIIQSRQLTKTLLDADWSFTKSELVAIDTFLTRSRNEWQKLFQSIDRH